MRHSSLLMLSVTTATVLILLTLPAFAQDDVDNSSEPDDPTIQQTEDTGIPTGTVIPEDVPTRESFDPVLEDGPPTGITLADYFRFFVALLVVVVVIWGLSLLMKRFVNITGLARSTESLKVIHTMNLTPTRILYLVRLGDRLLLIGGAEGGLRTLAEISDTEEVSQILREVEFKGNFDLNPFKTKLDGLMGEDDRDPVINEDIGVRQRKLDSMLDRLKNNSGNEPE